ncbi:unnamed protein product [Amaranthus hypochondriacus]
MERLGEATKKKVEYDGVVSVTQHIFQDNDWLSSVDAVVEELIQKTNGSKNVKGDVATAARKSTPVQTQEKPDVTNIPSALKECCSIKLRSCGVDVPYVSQFMITNKEIFKNMHSLEKEVMDYCFLKQTMDKFVFSFGGFYALSRDEAFSLKNNENISLNMIERNQDLALPDKELKAFLFTSQNCRALRKLMSEKDDEKANDLKVEVVDAWENHVNLINTNTDIKKITCFSFL